VHDDVPAYPVDQKVHPFHYLFPTPKERGEPMNEERTMEMAKQIGNMLGDLEKQISRPLTEENLHAALKTIHDCLAHLAGNKAFITEHH
jgi:hypothetical protein